jgi:predicted dehydrogenase
MAKIFQCAVIGSGMWGNKHVETIQKSGRGQVAWIAARTEATVAEVKNKYGIPKGTTDYREVLRDPGVDAVLISTPPYTHAEIAMAAMKAGKHLVLEKPMGINRAEMRRLVRESERHKDLVVLEASCRHARLQPKFDFIKGLIDSGKLGEIYFIHHNHLSQGTFVEYNPKGTWGMNKKLSGGGPFFDWGVYDLSFHLGLFGDKPKIKSVTSFTRNDLRDLSRLAPVTDVEQHGVAMLEFDTGLKYYYERGSGVHAETVNETRIYGTKGGLRFCFPSWDPKEVEWFHEDASGKPVKEVLSIDMGTYGGDDNEPFIAHWFDCIEGKQKPMMPLRLAAKHLDILFKILA